jgi:phosphatidylglycerol:prolipoprotein diacylglycerol transferase
MHPILLKLGPFTIYSYGFFVAVAFLVSSALVVRAGEKQGLSRSDVLDILIAILLGGLIGGRLLFVIINLSYFLENPVHIVMLNEGGMAFQGGLAGGMIAALIACRVKKVSFWGMLDLVSPYAALGHAIGRIGCLMNGCCYGKPVTSGFGLMFHGEPVMRAPVQIYESLSLLALFLVLLFIGRKRRFGGEIFSIYIMLYAVIRIALEPLRADNPVVFAGTTLANIISIGMLVAGAGLWWYLKLTQGTGYRVQGTGKN